MPTNYNDIFGGNKVPKMVKPTRPERPGLTPPERPAPPAKENQSMPKQPTKEKPTEQTSDLNNINQTNDFNSLTSGVENPKIDSGNPKIGPNDLNHQPPSNNPTEGTMPGNGVNMDFINGTNDPVPTALNAAVDQMKPPTAAQVATMLMPRRIRRGIRLAKTVGMGSMGSELDTQVEQHPAPPTSDPNIEDPAGKSAKLQKENSSTRTAKDTGKKLDKQKIDTAKEPTDKEKKKFVESNEGALNEKTGDVNDGTIKSEAKPKKSFKEWLIEKYVAYEKRKAMNSVPSKGTNSQNPNDKENDKPTSADQGPRPQGKTNDPYQPNEPNKPTESFEIKRVAPSKPVNTGSKLPGPDYSKRTAKAPPIGKASKTATPTAKSPRPKMPMVKMPKPRMGR